MITLSCASPVTSFASETPCGVDPAPAPQPQASSPPTSAQVKPRSLADQAATASRTRLGTVELNASSSSAMPGLGRPRGRSPALKNEVYQPAKRRNDDFNGKVNLAAAEVDDKGMLGGTRVYCRHLAFAYFMTPKKADFLNQVKDQAGIERFFSGGQLRAANQGLKKLRGAANLLNSSVVSAAGLSVQVIDIVQTMARSRQPNADFLITTSNHALAMNIQFKDQGRVCLTTYDPNTTTNHFRVEAKDRNDHATLASIAHCVACYSMLGNHAFTLYAKGNVFRPETALAYRQESGLSTAQKVTAAFICHALDRDDPGLINLLINNAAVENPRGGPGLKAALSATEHGFPGMYAALQNGRAHTVAAWMEGTRKLALNRMLSSNDVYELIAAQIWAESRGNLGADTTNANGKTDAGLMQVNADTFAGLKKENPGLLGNADVNNPHDNFMAGALYLRDQSKAFGGDVGAGLRAYNSGPDKVNRNNLEDTGGIGDPQYVANVLKFAQIIGSVQGQLPA